MLACAMLGCVPPTQRVNHPVQRRKDGGHELLQGGKVPALHGQQLPRPTHRPRDGTAILDLGLISTTSHLCPTPLHPTPCAVLFVAPKYFGLPRLFPKCVWGGGGQVSPPYTETTLCATIRDVPMIRRRCILLDNARRADRYDTFTRDVCSFGGTSKVTKTRAITALLAICE